MKGIARQNGIIFLIFVALLILLFTGMMVKKAPQERYILLSFDIELVDGEKNVTELLKVLDSEGITATFFVTGEYAEQYPAILRKMVKHEIACHGYSHKKFTKMNSSEKKEEIEKCKSAIKKATGKEVAGFRAPYTRIDHETMMLLDEEGFLYDASVIEGLGMFYPNVMQHKIGEIPVSSVLGIPLEDVIWTYYLGLPGTYFYLLKNKDTEIESYLFHPHHIMQHKNEFSEFIRHLKNQNVMFISHYGLIGKHEGV
jgi:peptidoglycan/xylan/chitin deacetylase (PgdA/CDA1 family)